MKKLFLIISLFVCIFMVSTAGLKNANAQEKAKNVILFLPDGMGFGSLTLFANYSYLYKKQPLLITQIMEKGNTAYCVTNPIKYVVPEGSSGVTEISTGVKTDILKVAQDAEGKNLKTIAEYAKDKGLSVGVVTNHRVSYYTTGAFLAHVKARTMENEIAVQEANSNVDVLLGGGIRNWIPQNKKAGDFANIPDSLGAGELSARKDDLDLIGQMKAGGYQVVYSGSDLDKIDSGKVLGLFGASALPFSIDLRSIKDTTSPSLAQMTKKAIEILSKNEKGFFLVVVEGGLDQLLHENDTAGTLAQLVEFDKAVKEAVDFADKDKNTLLLVASSHDTGGVAFSAHEDKTLVIENDFGSIVDFERLEMQKKSSHALLQEMGKDPSSAKIKEVISSYTAYDLTDEEAMWIKVFPADMFFPKYMGYPYGALGKIIGRKTGIVWVSQYHTALMTPLFGMGPGSEELKGTKETTDIFKVMEKSLIKE